MVLNFNSKCDVARARTATHHVTPIALVIGLLLCALLLPRAVAQETETAALPPGGATPELLESRMTAVKADAGLEEETKSLLLGLYQQASDDLKQTSAHAERAAALAAETQAAPELLRLLREQMATEAPVRPVDASGAAAETSHDRLQEQLKQSTAELVAAEARKADFERQLAEAQQSPPLIRERLDITKGEQEAVALVMGSALAPDDTQEVRQAKHWGQSVRSACLAAELHMLQQELLSQPLRVDLLKARLGKEIGGVTGREARVTALRDSLHARRRSEAAAAQRETEKRQQETAGLDPILDRLASENVALAGRLKEQAAEFDRMSDQREEAEALKNRIESDLHELQAAMQAYGRTEGFGRLLLRQHDSLPDIRSHVRRSRAREEQFAELGVRRLELREEARRMADLDQAVTSLEAQMSASKVEALHGSLVELVKERQELLGKTLDADGFYLAELSDVGVAEEELLKVAQTCEQFLEEQLLWLRSTEPTRWRDFKGVPGELRRLSAPAVWSEIGHTFLREAAPSPVFWLLLVLTVVSLAKRKTVILRIQRYAERLKDPLHDRFTHTLRAMGETMVVALPGPLLLTTLGWIFRRATPTSKLSYAIGLLCMGVALSLYLLRVLSTMCIPRGVAEAHFRWPERDVRRLRVALDRLAWVYVPTVLVVGFAIHLAPAEAGGVIARLGLMLWCIAFALFFYHVFQLRRGRVSPQRSIPAVGRVMRGYPLWCTLLLIFPLGLAALSLTGYVYSATVLSTMFIRTMAMVACLVVLHQLAMRSVWLVRRRLAYAAAEVRQEAAAAARGGDEEEASVESESALAVENPLVDLSALSDDTGELVKMAAIAAGLAGLYVIWHEVVPALRIFDEVTLWHTTLGDVGLAALIVVVTTVLARRLPALSEIVLLRFANQPAGTRYATTTLVVYAVVTLGALLALNAIGLRWSQFQWLIAALGVGIGFGLQEMVANFISGLIILFERPIRVGDIVTVGDTDGVVTRIRIRATTIRNWDRKELLVPNKEFITGRLLNWTLSDQVTRVVVVVGVAYGSDTDRALALMKQAATEHPDVLEDPAPGVTFDGFGDSALSLTLRAYLDRVDQRLPTTTDLHQAIDRKFKQAGIVIAFPQRDVHLDVSEILRVTTAPQDEDVAATLTQDQHLPERSDA